MQVNIKDDDILKHLLYKIAEDFGEVVSKPYEPKSITEADNRLRLEIFYLLTLAHIEGSEVGARCHAKF